MPEVIRTLRIVAYPFGLDCAGEFFSEKSRISASLTKKVWYKHGTQDIKFEDIGEVLGYELSPDGGIAILGLYQSDVLDRIVDAHLRGRLFCSTTALLPTVMDTGEILEWNDAEISLIDVTEADTSMIPCNFRARSLNLKGVLSNVKVKCGCGKTAAEALIEELADEITKTLEEEDSMTKEEEEAKAAEEASAKAVEEAKKATEAEEEEKDKKVSGEDETNAKGSVSDLFASGIDRVNKAVEEKDYTKDYVDTLVTAGIVEASEAEGHVEILKVLAVAGNKKGIQTYQTMLESSKGKKTFVSSDRKLERVVTAANKTFTDEDYEKMAEEILPNITY